MSARSDAKAAGRSFYYSPQPCKRGHTCKRSTLSGHCVECHALIQARWDVRHREQRNASRVRRYNADEEFAARCRENGRVAYHRKMGAEAADKPISVIAEHGTTKQSEAKSWLLTNSRRLGVTMSFLLDGLRNGFTLNEIEKMKRKEAHVLGGLVSKHLRGDGFTPSEEAW